MDTAFLNNLFDAPSEKTSFAERTLLVNVPIRGIESGDVEEFKLLAGSAGAKVLEVVHAPRNRPDPATYIGSGKAQDLAQRVQADEVGLVIFNHELSPAQERNLEKILQCRVLDRSGLILDIFAQRAQTHEGKLQVELAQLEHLSTRLIRGWTHLERQKGGIGLRGPGETQLETDRRLIQVRLGQLKSRLAKVRQSRSQNRARRQKTSVPTVSLVGYTNAGKSTLFNALTQSEVLAADQLFATLDPTLRRVTLPGVGEAVLVDTVGFVSHLPHELVESFRATLEETIEADLLLHVIDASASDMVEQIQAVDQVLADIGTSAKVIRVFNKIDKLVAPVEPLGHVETSAPKAYVSAHTGEGIGTLLSLIQEHFTPRVCTFHLTLPAAAGRLRSRLHELGVVRLEQVSDKGEYVLEVQHGAQALKTLLLQHGFELKNVMPQAESKQFEPVQEMWERS